MTELNIPNYQKKYAYMKKAQISDDSQTQAEFNCIIKDLDENQEYNSFEIFDSENIAGIPHDKILLLLKHHKLLMEIH